MYVWQMNDGTWRISTMTNSRIVIPYGTIERRLLDGIYASRAEAELAERRLRMGLRSA